MDSIFVYKNHLVYNPSDLLFTIVQDSIRFAVLKPLAVYREENYLGTYRIVGKSDFEAGNLTPMLSFLVFGSKLDEGLKELKTLKVKGRMSEKTKMTFICLEHIKYEKRYSLQEKAYNI